MSFNNQTDQLNVLNMAYATVPDIVAFSRFMGDNNLWEEAQAYIEDKGCASILVSVEPIRAIQQLLRQKLFAGELSESARPFVEMVCGPLPDPHTPGSPTRPGYPPDPGPPPPPVEQ